MQEIAIAVTLASVAVACYNTFIILNIKSAILELELKMERARRAEEEALRKWVEGKIDKGS